ncbi:unnamed protein product [Cladocopium goreaui]|uniref:Protein kinase domain-containing protein n=1 Tax=Cladocopium goreaui TaxID=2562237 RepID=A0A9P1CET0_9DINO|nr:unnamed protein product [Cladocopium goreaui]
MEDVEAWTGVIYTGSWELDRLQEILSLADDGAFHADDGAFPFGPVTRQMWRRVDSQGFLLPHDNFLGACETAEAADAALERLREEDLLVIHLFSALEGNHVDHVGYGIGVLVVGSSQHVELFDLFALRAETEGTELVNWPLLAQKLRGILSQQDVLKIVPWPSLAGVWGGIEELIDMAIELGLGIARSLKPNEKDPVGPVLDSQSLLQELFPGSGWPSIFRRVLGLRLCLEEEGSNWSRRQSCNVGWARPLRRSQLHHAAVMTWTQLPVLHALCAKTSLLPEAKLRGHVCVQSRTRFWLRSRDGGKHVLGQLAPPGRMVEPKGARGTASSFTRVALLEDSENQEEVEVVSDLIGNSAMVVPLGADLATPRRVDARCLRAVNCWSSSVWVERLMAAASVDRGEEFFGTVDQLAVAEVMPAFTSRLAMSTTTRTLAGIHQSRRGDLLEVVFALLRFGPGQWAVGTKLRCAAELAGRSMGILRSESLQQLEAAIRSGADGLAFRRLDVLMIGWPWMACAEHGPAWISSRLSGGKEMPGTLTAGGDRFPLFLMKQNGTDPLDGILSFSNLEETMTAENVRFQDGCRWTIHAQSPRYRYHAMGSPSTPSAVEPPATPATEPWRKDLDSGAQLSIWSSSGGCWTLGKIIDANAERLKVDYVVDGERVEKTVLRESLHLRQAPGPPGPPGPGGPSMVQQAVVRPWHPPMQLPPVPAMTAQAAAAVPQVLPPGHLRLADLQIGQMLGSGGFGSVHRGFLRGYPKEVAIKKLHVMGGVTKEHVAEFYKEVANLQALRHERLIQLIGIACEMPLLCIVTELAAGGSLHDLLHVKRVMLQEAQKLRLILQMTEGVMFLHGQRPPFVHRDLKSANVVLDAELNAKLCDLGITELGPRHRSGHTDGAP